MPGVLMSEDDRRTVKVNMAIAGLPAPAMSGEPSRKRKADEMLNGDVPTNGLAPPPPSSNGTTYANGRVADPPVSQQQMLEAAVQSMYKELPPIEHVTQGYLPLHRLITRLAQDTFNGLEELINELADMQPAQSGGPSYTNGAGPSRSAQVNLQKKNRLWDFAQDRRAKFIKLLVLSQWSRQSELVSKVVDLNYWLECQKGLYRDATSWMGELKRMLASVKLPAPDLQMALEALSTGRTASLPDLGYLPPTPLSPEQLLRALQTINTLLTIRLNLHESIPPAFKNFSIASGRVTFRIANEFELDLSIADEDPSSQLFFVDFRFAFSPCAAEIPEGRLRNEIEGKTNDILRREGLQGCYEFLHDLVLTHKLRILRQQAVEMAREQWVENVKVEPVHRSVVLQYWINRPGGKNWIEVGIRKGKPKHRTFSFHKTETSHIAVRWHRHGKEVVDHKIKMDLQDLSMDGLLKHVIALHSNYIFRATKRKLREGELYGQKLLTVKHRASLKEPAECSLRIQVTSTRTVTLLQEPVSGAFSLSPPSNLHSHFERDLNILRDPANEVPARVAQLRCLSALERIDARTKMVGWQSLRSLNPPADIVKRLFGKEILQLRFFRLPSWDARWVLAATTSMLGDAWWLVELRPAAASSGGAATKVASIALRSDQHLQRTFRIPLAEKDALLAEPSYVLLAQVECAAAAIASRYSDAKELHRLQIDFIQHQPSGTNYKVRIPDLLIRFPSQHVPAMLHTRDSRLPWCHELVKSVIIGLNRSQASVIHLICARLVTPVRVVRTIGANVDDAIAFNHHSGAFTFRLVTPFGTSSVRFVLERFTRVERLVGFLDTIRREKLQCTAISLGALTFTYPAPTTTTTPQLTATLTFITDTSLRISFERTNPHLRIQDFLTTLLNGPSTDFGHVTSMLAITLPLLSAFDAVESAPAMQRMPGRSVHVLPRSAVWYRVVYEGPRMVYEVRLRKRGDEVAWFVTYVVEAGRFGVGTGVEGDGDGDGGMGRGSGGVDAIWDMLGAEAGGGLWMGMRTAIVARVEGVEGLVGRIDGLWWDVGERGGKEDG